MEKKVKTIQMPKEIIKYVANDGTEFGSEEECKKYEETAICAITAAVNGITVNSCCGDAILDSGAPFCCDGFLRAIKIKNVDDVETVNRWIIALNKENKSNCITPNAIGSTFIFEEYDRWVYPHGDIEEMVKVFRESLEKYLGEETQEENV